MLWPAYRFASGDRRGEVVALAVVALGLALTGPRSRRLYGGLYPLGLVAIAYDAMKLLRRAGAARVVHACDLRDLDTRLFGVVIDGRLAPVHELLREHRSPALDLLCAVPYATYLPLVVACALLLHLRDRRALGRFGWAFFAVNLAGFVTYQVFPAAPPWYVDAHGCAVDLAATASPGPHLARVDAWLGVPYFADFYARSSEVFGAVPSLHVAYPAVAALEGFGAFGRPLRVGAVAYVGAMCFAAVYLDHHWVVDVVLGLAYALAASAAVRVAQTLARARAVAAPCVDVTAPRGLP